ncbi:hypothetical protein PMF13cell1_04063 [Blautia producta]|uniref:Cache domain-containing protein n=1 Tax=Blautia producta TaxID=33035 RepID=A0A4P6M520_9FIRM|nr:hypothetical protein [Blautia producta]QBE98497.1 hypothetical protein PMF13cell1_04063 [Blautia producta]
MRRKKISRICCLAALIFFILGPGMGFARYCSMAAKSSCISAQGQIEKNLESTLNLLEVISQESWMLPEDIPYQEKADRLDHYNEIWGYQMIRAVDTFGGVYRADKEEAVSDLNSREYIQTLWLTDEPQITDVFLAGADGKTLNYTVAVAVAGDAKNNGAVFAAIYDSEMRTVLSSQPMHTILLGKNQQCMSGNDESLIGTTLESRLEGKKIIGESLESVLLRVKNEESGTIWFLDGLVPTCYAFQNVGLNSGWTVITSVSYTDVAGNLRSTIVVSVLGVFASLAAFLLLRRPEE